MFNCGQARQCRGADGFTLVELLVVIAVIGLLAALLLPALSAGKARAQSTMCKNNLRQVGLALTLYVSDSRRYPPMWGKIGGSFGTWADKLTADGRLNWTNRSWHCPSYLASGGVIQFRSPPKEVFYGSYSYNGYGIAGLENSPKHNLGLGELPLSAAMEPEVLAPSEMYAVGDTRTYRDFFIWGEGVVRGVVGCIAMLPYDRPKEETAPLHQPGYNILCADGHVTLVKRRDYLYPPRTAQHWNRDNQPHQEAWAPRNEWAVQQ